jgi:hypothetical protein
MVNPLSTFVGRGASLLARLARRGRSIDEIDH